jgi:hypothetical protein
MTLRNVIVMVVIALVAVLAWFALADQGGTKKGTTPSSMPESFDRAGATKVVVRAHDGMLTFHRRADRSDAWEVEAGTARVRADADLVEDLLTGIARQQVRSRQDAKAIGDDRRGMGLDAPKFEVWVTTPGKVDHIRYGSAAVGGPNTVWADEGPGTAVWQVSSGVEHQILELVTQGGKSKRLTDIRLFDLASVEIQRKGVTDFQAERDATGVWRVSQPYKGIADPTQIEQMLSALVNVPVNAWEVDVTDLVKFGLEPPRAVVILGRKQGAPVEIHLGNDTPDGQWSSAMEKGVRNVGQIPAAFAKAAATDPLKLRDRSFSRFGIDGVAVRFRFGDLTWDLRKEGASWEIWKPIVAPGDERAIREFLEELRGWTTLEFQDLAKPEDHGIDGTKFVEIELARGGKTLLLLGNAVEDGKSYWAQRKSPDGDGGVERVDGGVVEKMRKGHLQFKRKVVRDYDTWKETIVRIARDKGMSEEGAALQTEVVSRDVAEGADHTWKTNLAGGPGMTGFVDGKALHDLLSALTLLTTTEWLPISPANQAEYGFVPPRADLMVLTITFADSAMPAEGREQQLFIGKKHPGGGRYAWFGTPGHPGPDPHAFVISDELVKKLSAPLITTEKK